MLFVGFLSLVDGVEPTEEAVWPKWLRLSSSVDRKQVPVGVTPTEEAK